MSSLVRTINGLLVSSSITSEATLFFDSFFFLTASEATSLVGKVFNNCLEVMSRVYRRASHVQVANDIQ